MNKFNKCAILLLYKGLNLQITIRLKVNKEKNHAVIFTIMCKVSKTTNKTHSHLSGIQSSLNHNEGSRENARVHVN